MYWIWQNAELWKCPEIVTFTSLDPIERLTRYYTEGGVRLSEQLPLITFSVANFSGLHDRDSLWAGAPYLVFSERLRNVLTNVGVNNLQYFPACIKNLQTSELDNSFMIANIIGVVFCLNWERSSVVRDSEFPDGVETITSLSLDTSKIPADLQLFRLGELSTVLICSSKVKDAVTSAGINGVKFIEPENFSL